MFKAKRTARQDFEQVLSSVEMTRTSELLRDKKAAMLERAGALSSMTEETRALAASISDKLRLRAEQRPQREVDGVVFVNYQGSIIHVNKAACDLLGKADLIGQQVEHVLTGTKRSRLSVKACSQALMEALISGTECPQLNALTTGSLQAKLDEPVIVALKRGKLKVELCVRLSLLDVAPKELEDVTYICYISAYKASA